MCVLVVCCGWCGLWVALESSRDRDPNVWCTVGSRLAREVFPEYMACFSHENGSVRAAAIYHATNMFHYAETQRNVLLRTLFSLGPHAASSLHTLLCECMHLPTTS
jgi:hypothetical protein